MSGREREVDVAQESFFVLNPTTIILPTNNPGAVDIAFRSSHLDNSLKLRDEALELKRFVSRGLARQRYGKVGADNILNNVAEKYADSELEFNRAYGLDIVLEVTDPAEHELVREETKKAYIMFYSGYGNEEMKPSPERKRRKKLPEIRDELGRIAKLYAEIPRQEHVNIAIPVEITTTDTGVKEQILGLTVREKMEVSKYDSRAGFYPTSRIEATSVATYLNYLDNPDLFPLGPQNQLLEVANFHLKHQGTEIGMKYGSQAGRSIANMFGDFYSQASEQLAELLEVERLLVDTDALPNFDISLAKGLHVDMLLAVPLVRYMDLSEYVATGEIVTMYKGKKTAISFDPVRTRYERSGMTDGRNKVLYDPYAKDRSKAATKWLKTRMMTTPLKTGRGVINGAIEDQQNRVAFHRGVLLDFLNTSSSAPILVEASIVAEQILSKTGLGDK